MGKAQAALIGGTFIEGAAHGGAVLRLLDGPSVNERVESMLALQAGVPTGSYVRKGGGKSMVLAARLSRKLAGLLVRAAEGATGPAAGLHADGPEAAASAGEMPEVRPTIRDRAKLRVQERGQRAAAAARELLQRYACAGTAGSEAGRSVPCGRLLCGIGAAAVYC